MNYIQNDARAFADIAAYTGREFDLNLGRLLKDPQFHSALESMRKAFQRLPSPSDSSRYLALKKNVNASIEGWKQRLGAMKNPVDFRRFMLGLVRLLLERTSKGLTLTGLDQDVLRSADRGVCFLSNHRSTSLDPIFVNYALGTVFGRSAFNAAGDNIFRTPWLGHLIRLNGGFVVKRDVEGIDEKIAEAEKLSGYINDLLERKEWVWIAHRNGRSKDGTDRTDSAVLAMLKKTRKELEWSDYAARSALVPVSISYEMIPLDLHMASELAGREIHSGVQRDMMNIFTEITQEKGRMHVAFGSPVTSTNRSGVVQTIDDSIHANARLFESNLLAWCRLHPEAETEKALLRESFDLSRGAEILVRRKELVPEARRAFLGMYAAPVENALRIHGSIDAVLADQKARFAETRSVV